MKANLKAKVFEMVSDLNAINDPRRDRQSADILATYAGKSIATYCDKSSLAWKIYTDTNAIRYGYSEKQLWVMAFELLKNESFVAEFSKELEDIEARETVKKAHKRAQRHAKAEAKKSLSMVDTSKAETGRKVKSPAFGEGVIITANKEYATVDFNGVERKLMLKFAKLEYLN